MEGNCPLIQGQGQSVTNRLGKTKYRSNVRGITDKIQAFSIPTTGKELQAFVGLLGYWRSFSPQLAQILKPLYVLVKKGSQWD